MGRFENNDGVDNKDFARQQYQFLKEQGVTDRMELSRIFKAAGPGQVQEAWKLANSESWEGEKGEYRETLLLLITTGSHHIRIGRESMEGILKSFEFYVPVAKNDNCFFRVLKGASEILYPGAYRFSNKEIQEIREGLKKRVYDAENEQEGEDVNEED
jgi:hypothetical protein